MDLDLEQDVVALGRARNGRAVEIAVELGPLEETLVLDGVLEGRSVDEPVLVTVFGRSGLARRPTSTQPEMRVVGDQLGRKCSLTDTTRSDED